MEAPPLELTSIELSASGKLDPKETLEVIQKDRDQWQKNTEGMQGFSRWEIPMQDALRTETENNLGLARMVMVDVGYTPDEADHRLPKPEQIHMYKTDYPGNIVHGTVPTVKDRIEIELGTDIQLENHRRIDPAEVHEIGHYVAVTVFGPGAGKDSPVRLFSMGLDNNMSLNNGINNTYMKGVLHEPLADLFGYYCTEKRGDGSVYHSQKYALETAFTVSLLQQLSEIRGTKFFDEFARMFKSFNERDYKYFVTIRDDFAHQWEREGLDYGTALRKATKLVAGLNNIQTENGKDQEGPTWGRQTTAIATEAGFQDKFLSNYRSILGGGLVLDGAKTVMTNNVYR